MYLLLIWSVLHESYDGVLDINWSRKFRIEVDMFENVVSGISPEQLAQKETTCDKNGFDLLCPAVFKIDISEQEVGCNNYGDCRML